jgi:hypothetical protein
MATSPTPRPRTAASAGTVRRSAGSAGSSGRRPARSSGSGSNSMPMVLGGVGVLVVIVVLVMMSSGGGGKDTTGAAPGESAAKPAATTQPAPAAAPVQLAAAKAGKAPSRPAPPLTQEMLQQINALLAEAKELNNEGVKARSAGDNQGAREKQSAAKAKLDTLEQLVQPAIEWHDAADLEGWAMPAEYMSLEKLYAQVGPLVKRVRMGGGT